MTYHPIDKPTEPGWYWLDVIGREGLLCVNVRSIMYDDRPTLAFTFGAVQGDFHVAIYTEKHQWYGPAIQPPQKETT